VSVEDWLKCISCEEVLNPNKRERGKTKSKLKYPKKETSVEEIENNLLLPISIPAAD
jgi:hypothetical protein